MEKQSYTHIFHTRYALGKPVRRKTQLEGDVAMFYLFDWKYGYEYNEV